MDSPYAAELTAAQQQVLPAEFEGLGLLYQEPSGKRHQPDKPAANLLQQVIGADLRHVLRYMGPSMPWQHYDCKRGVWMPIDASYAASVLQELYMAWHASDNMRRLPAAYWSAATHERMLNLRTARDVLALMTGFLHDPDLLDRMDTKLAEGLIPFANTCVKVEAAGVRLVPHSPDNYISKTVEYELPLAGEGVAAPPPGLDFSWVDRFYETYWDAPHKRATVMKTVAATLLPHMMSRQKNFIIGTDTADGNTGKSVWSGVLLDVMSVLGQPLQPALVYDSASLGNRNGHGANELSYRGAYMAVLDEMKTERRFDMEALKKLAGGGIKVSCRMFGSSKSVTFPWLALPILLCNQRCLPQMDSSSTVDLGRFRFICFETRFVTPTGAGVPEGYDQRLLKEGREGVAAEMCAHRGAHMWRLLQAAHALASQHGGALSDADWPEDWKQLKETATSAADPLAQAVREVVLASVEQGVVVAKGGTYVSGQSTLTATEPIVDCVSRQ